MHTASINIRWINRFLLISGMILFWAILCLYDGFYAWPLENKIAIAYQEHVKENRMGEWKDFVKIQGWSIDPEKSDPGHIRTGKDIMGQFVMAAISLSIVFYFLVGKILLERKHTLRADAEACFAPDGRRIPHSAFRRMDLRKWDSKGLAYLHYTLPDGVTGKLTVDDMKFANVDPILETALLHAPSEAVIEGEVRTLKNWPPPAPQATDTPKADAEAEKT